MMRSIWGAALAVAVALLAAACGGSQSRSGNAASSLASSKHYGVLRWGLATPSGPIDWNRNVSSPSVVIIEQLAVQNLVEFEPSGRIKPGVATFERTSPTRWVYHIRPGLKFSDGKPVTSADVVYSLDRNIVGKEEWTKAFWEDVAHISGRGSSTVVVKLKRPSAVWQDVLGFSGEVIEKAEADRIGEKALGTPGHPLIGTGPWKIDSYEPNASVRLSRNPYWTGERQPAEKIDISLFKEEAPLALAVRSGALDGTFLYQAPKLFTSIPGTRQMITSGFGETSISVNTQKPPFNDVHVRHAIAYATDVEGMRNAVYPGQLGVDDVTLAPASLFSNLGSTQQVHTMLASLPSYHFNLAAARRELAKSAYPHGFTTKIEVEASASNLVLIAQALAADLAKIGITAKLDELQTDETTQLLSGKINIALNESYPAYPDPEGITYALSSSQINPPGSGLNNANYSNATVDRLLAEESETLNPAKRLRLFGELLGIEGQDVAYIPLFTHGTFGTLSNKYVFPTFSEWRLYTPWALGVKLAQ
jgi:peptide/nickel transport system substrate-binding protein